MNRLLTMHDKVKFVLTNYPKTRDDDRMAVCAVYALFYDVDLNTPFKEIMDNEKLPNFETIRRCRQKVQADNEALRGRRNKERLEHQKKFVEYALTDTEGGKI